MANITRKYKTAQELSDKLDEYFSQCMPANPDGQWPNDDDMALFCDFLDPDSFDEYVKMSEKDGETQDYAPPVRRAKARLRASYKQRLNYRDTARGAQFVLSACYGLSERTIQANEDITQDRPDTAEAEAVADEVGRTINLRKAKAG